MSRAALMLVLAPLLLVPKCLGYDGPSPDAAGGDDAAARDAAGTDASRMGPAPAIACERPGIARLRVRNYAFEIQCGCREREGHTCTIPIGTSVVWAFQDSDTHNVTGVAGRFGASEDQLTGAHEVVFPQIGTYDYGCSIHSGIMSGYRIEVVE